MNRDFWADYNFVLVLGPPPKKIRQRRLTDCPYKETHTGETGVVFFPALETGKSLSAGPGPVPVCRRRPA